MQGILNFVNDNNGAFIVLFSFLVAGATIVYAILTWKLVSETKKIRKVQTEPDVCAYIETIGGWMPFTRLKIENIGLGPAHDIKFEINQDFEVAEDLKLSDLAFIKHGIRYLAPKQKISPFLFSLKNIEKIQKSLEIIITFQDNLRRDFLNTFNISKEDFPGVQSELESGWFGKITYEVRQIKQHLASISSAITKLKR